MRARCSRTARRMRALRNVSSPTVREGVNGVATVRARCSRTARRMRALQRVRSPTVREGVNRRRNYASKMLANRTQDACAPTCQKPDRKGGHQQASQLCEQDAREPHAGCVRSNVSEARPSGRAVKLKKAMKKSN